jgi:hypothetical protein
MRNDEVRIYLKCLSLLFYCLIVLACVEENPSCSCINDRRERIDFLSFSDLDDGFIKPPYR